MFGLDSASLNENTRFEEDLQCKSVNMVQLSATLEDEFEIEVPFAAFKDIKTFGDAGDFIDQALAG